MRAEGNEGESFAEDRPFILSEGEVWGHGEDAAEFGARARCRVGDRCGGGVSDIIGVKSGDIGVSSVVGVINGSDISGGRSVVLSVSGGRGVGNGSGDVRHVSGGSSSGMVSGSGRDVNNVSGSDEIGGVSGRGRCDHAVNQISTTLKKLHNSGDISKTEYQKMKPEGSITPRFYGFPKVHMPGVLIRPIVSLTATPTLYRPAKELHWNLKYLVDKTIHSTHSSQEFLNIIEDTRMEEDQTMISFNITALFTSINIDPAKETIAILLDKSGRQASHNTNSVNKTNTLKLLDLFLTTHFIFNDHIFKQINRTPIGAPISGLIAE
eukprot:g30312.t1